MIIKEYMLQTNEYNFVVLEVLRGINFVATSTGKNDDLTYSLSAYDPKSNNFQIVFDNLAKIGLISTPEKWEASIDGANKKINYVFNFSILDKEKFDKLFIELTEKYKHDPRQNNSKLSITIGKRGIYLTLDKNRIYEVEKGRKEIVELLTNGPCQTKTLAKKTNHEGDEKYIIDAVAGINTRFSKKVVKKLGEKIIISTSEGYSLNMDEYEIGVE